MKLIESNNETVTLQFTREELKELSRAVSDAITENQREEKTLPYLIHDCEGIEDADEIWDTIREAGREEETLEDLKKALKYATEHLPKLYDLSEDLTRIAWKKDLTTNRD
jgi:hypothetical protein